MGPIGEGNGHGHDHKDGQQPEGFAPKEPLPLGSAAFEEVYGEPISKALDLSTWQTGVNLDELYSRFGDDQVADALKLEAWMKPRIREQVFALIPKRKEAPPGAGHY